MNTYMMYAQWPDGQWLKYFKLHSATAIEAVLTFAEDAAAQGEQYIGVRAELIGADHE